MLEQAKRTENPEAIAVAKFLHHEAIAPKVRVKFRRETWWELIARFLLRKS